MVIVDNLSSAQFGGVVAPVTPSPMHPDLQMDRDAEGPLPITQSTFGSVRAASAWRRPQRVLPLGQATFGSVFQPFGPPSA